MKATELLRHIAHGYRLSWADFDGRSAKAQLNQVADLIEREHAGEDVSAEVDALIAEELESQQSEW